MKQIGVWMVAGAACFVACDTSRSDAPASAKTQEMNAMGSEAPAIAPSAMRGRAATPAATSVAGITWEVPQSWENQGQRPMRVASYRIPHTAGDNEDGEFAVYFFGAQQGGGVEANVQRWLGQIQQPDGSSSADKAKRQDKIVEGIKVTTLEVDGTYMYSPRPMSSEKIAKPNYRLLAAVVHAPEGSVFFKLTAPAKTAQASQFDQLVQSIRRES